LIKTQGAMAIIKSGWPAGQLPVFIDNMARRTIGNQNPMKHPMLMIPYFTFMIKLPVVGSFFPFKYLR